MWAAFADYAADLAYPRASLSGRAGFVTAGIGVKANRPRSLHGKYGKASKSVETSAAPRTAPQRAFDAVSSSRRSDYSQITSLLDNGQDPNELLLGGRTPLYMSCYFRIHAVAEKLLRCGAKANAASCDVTVTLPIDIACAYGDQVLVTLLLDHGADPNTRRRRRK